LKSRLFLLLIGLGISPAGLAALGASPFLEQTNLFEAGQGGYALYRIPGVIVTTNGSILIYCEARRSNGDWAPMDVLVRRSTDGGRSWSSPAIIPGPAGPVEKNPVRGKSQSEGTTCNNPMAIADENGSIHLLFCVEYMRCFYLQSQDDGLTWSQPREITKTFDQFRPEYDWRVIATGPGHGIQLRNGRLVVPVWLSLGTGKNNHSPSVSAVIYSDDHGNTWRRGDVAARNTEQWPSPNETAAIELADAGVMLNIRSPAAEHLRLVTRSKDGVSGWATPKFDRQLFGPPCMGSLARYSTRPLADRNRILFSQPAALDPIEENKKPSNLDRKNLTIRLSYDEGGTWPVRKTLESGPSAYSDLAVLPDRTIVCFYERAAPGSAKPSPYGCLTFARFNLAWLTDGKDASTP
jgi:sialidase-1